MSQKTNSIFDSTLLKGVIIAILTILLLLPISMVTSLIEERNKSNLEVTEEISTKWGGTQDIVGPALIVPYQKHIAIDSKEKNVQTYIEYAYILPDDYNVSSNINVEERSRSIYKTLVYKSLNTIKGTFSPDIIHSLKIDEADILWKDAFIILGVSNMQGIKNKVSLEVNGQKYEASSGVPTNSFIKSGMTVQLPIDKQKGNKQLNFSLILNLNGSEVLQIAPIGKENKIKMLSDWNTVSFSGDFLPSSRNIETSGFEAEWDIFDYNRNYIQTWTGSNNITLPLTGIELKYSVDQYQMSMRSVKYAIMFILLTFVIFFFVEIITKRKIHPAQYVLVSLALVIFYSLLVALSEHISFNLAYLISAIAIVLMITLYIKTIFIKWKATFMMGGFIAALYLYLYIILQMEDMSLLIGSIGLFVALGAVMYASRNVDWYNKREDESPK